MARRPWHGRVCCCHPRVGGLALSLIPPLEYGQAYDTTAVTAAPPRPNKTPGEPRPVRCSVSRDGLVTIGSRQRSRRSHSASAHRNSQQAKQSANVTESCSRRMLFCCICLQLCRPMIPLSWSLKDLINQAGDLAWRGRTRVDRDPPLRKIESDATNSRGHDRDLALRSLDEDIRQPIPQARVQEDTVVSWDAAESIKGSTVLNVVRPADGR